MQVAYITRKVFADDSQEVRIKHNPLITDQTVKNAQKTKALNKIKREMRELRLYEQINKLNLFDTDYVRKHRILQNELKLRNIQNVSRSAHRSRQNLYDICRCNEFAFFVTWTFDKDKIDRLNDNKVKRKFTQFQNYLRKKFPDMYYVAVPEYHKRGGLHFHLLIGGVTMDELKAVPAKNKRGKLIFKNGKQIYNVSRWRLGFSTLSAIGNGEATKHYICKYISKQHLDDRFFGKRRYYVSKNIRRPEVEKYCTSPERSLDGIDLNVFTVAYANKQKKYAVLTHDGNGIVQFDRNTDEVKENMAKLAAPTKSASERTRGLPCAAAPSGARPYSTLRTLDSTNYQADTKTAANQPPTYENAEAYCREIGLID